MLLPLLIVVPFSGLFIDVCRCDTIGRYDDLLSAHGYLQWFRCAGSYFGQADV